MELHQRRARRSLPESRWSGDGRGILFHLLHQFSVFNFFFFCIQRPLLETASVLLLVYLLLLNLVVPVSFENSFELPRSFVSLKDYSEYA